jgi:hypothetical protein
MITDDNNVKKAKLNLDSIAFVPQSMRTHGQLCVYRITAKQIPYFHTINLAKAFRTVAEVDTSAATARTIV